MQASQKNKSDLGAIRIHNKVVAAIVVSAVLEVEGVVGMRSGLTQELAQLFGKKEFEKGVKINIEENKTKLDVSIIVKYGCNIPKIAREVQIKTKEAVEKMTGLSVLEINVGICRIKLNESRTSEAKQT